MNIFPTASRRPTRYIQQLYILLDIASFIAKEKYTAAAQGPTTSILRKNSILFETYVLPSLRALNYPPIAKYIHLLSYRLNPHFKHSHNKVFRPAYSISHAALHCQPTYQCWSRSRESRLLRYNRKVRRGLRLRWDECLDPLAATSKRCGRGFRGGGRRGGL